MARSDDAEVLGNSEEIKGRRQFGCHRKLEVCGAVAVGEPQEVEMFGHVADRRRPCVQSTSRAAVRREHCANV